MKVSEFVKSLPSIISSDIIDDIEIDNIVIDSRKVKQHDVFIAIKGETHDANLFTKDVIKKKASLLILSDKKIYDSLGCNKVLVVDGAKFLIDTAKVFFDRFEGKKILITGSFGKTSSKELLKCILSTKYKVYATEGNYNNELGVSLTGINLDMNADYIIIEAGSNAMGEIELLSKMVKPDMVVITNIGHAHIGRFGSYENIIMEKLSAVDAIAENGAVFLPREFYNNVQYKKGLDIYTFGDKNSNISLSEIVSVDNGVTFKVTTGDKSYRLNHIYHHIAFNCLPLILLAEKVGLSSDEIYEGIKSYSPINGRGNIFYSGGSAIVDDTYNAGFESVISTVNSIANINDRNKYVILGEMGEIDGYEQEFYSKIISLVTIYNDIKFYFLGASFSKFIDKGTKKSSNVKLYSLREKLLDDLLKIDKNEKSILLFKASRSKRFDTLVSELIDMREKENHNI